MASWRSKPFVLLLPLRMSEEFAVVAGTNKVVARRSGGRGNLQNTGSVGCGSDKVGR